MSVEASSWAFAQQNEALPSGAKFLLVAIANRADKSGVAYPGHATLADDCSCRPETVTANIKRLEQLGLITRFQRRRKSGSRTSDWIVLAPDAADRGPMIDAPADEYPEEVALAARIKPEKTSGEEASGDESSGEETTRGHLRKTGGPYEPSEEPSASPPNPLTGEFAAWLDHHERATGLKPPRPGTAARREIEAMFGARRGEGYSPDDLRFATIGAFNDPFRRENGHFGCVSVLRPKKVHDLVEKGRQFARRAHQRGAGQLSHRDQCRRCRTAIGAREANNQSGLCDRCYADFERQAGGEAA